MLNAVVSSDSHIFKLNREIAKIYKLMSLEDNKYEYQRLWGMALALEDRLSQLVTQIT